MKKLTEILVNLISKLGITFIGIDKQIHFLIGFLVSMGTFFLTWNLLAGLFMSAFAGYIREFYGERFDMEDFYFTLGGGIIFSLITLIINYVI
jgi:ABC-type multidrug transport system permease subunit